MDSDFLLKLEYHLITTLLTRLGLKHFNYAEQVRLNSVVYPKIISIVIGSLGAVTIRTIRSLDHFVPIVQSRAVGTHIP